MYRVKISVRNLCKTFGQKKVLNNFNIDIYEGECFVILGGSGCGKTVFIKTLSGLLDADANSSITLDGVEVCNLNQNKKLQLFDKISFAFQLNALFDSYKIWQNICFKYLFDGKFTKQQMIDISKEKLKQVNLNEEIINFHPKDLSGGMQKRVAIARALASDPEVVFFDEPTSGLDPLTSEKIAHLIKNCDKDQPKIITKISIMHDIKSALAIADRIAFLKDGKINWIGTPNEIKTTTNLDVKEFVESGI